MLEVRQAALGECDGPPRPPGSVEEVNVVEVNTSSYRFFVFKVSQQESDGGEAAGGARSVVK